MRTGPKKNSFSHKQFQWLYSQYCNIAKSATGFLVDAPRFHHFCKINRFRKILAWLYRKVNGPIIYDSSKIIQHHVPEYQFHLFVDPAGKLKFHDRYFTKGEYIGGAFEWDNELKRNFKIHESDVVLDFFITTKA